MDIRLEPKQGIAFQTEATEVLYGGAAGGMKSFLLRASAMRWCADVAGVQVYLFRRTLPDLRDNHLRGPSSFHVMLADLVQSGHVKYRAVENEFEFWNGSILHLCYCDSEGDVEKYRGAEIHVLLIDELTHFSEYQYRFLRSRVRVAGLKVPEKYKGRLPRIETASNPGSIGHAWVKRTFISPKPAMEVWRAGAEEGGMLRQFIPAKLAENPYLTRDDPQYADRLRGLGASELVRAMLDGDWDIIAGQAFEKLRRDLHGIEAFEIPRHWMRFRAMDWGSARPFCVDWYAVASEDVHVRNGAILSGDDVSGAVLVQRGCMVMYRQWYGWTGKANEGLRMEVGEVAQGVVSRSGDERYAWTVGDPSMWKVDGGPSHAESMLRHGVPMRRGDNSRNAGYVEMRSRIAGTERGPMLFVFKSCHDGFWRTLPDLVMDEHTYGPKSEDVDTQQEDHAYDACRYACMSRPWAKPTDKKPESRRDWLFDKEEDDADESWRTA